MRGALTTFRMHPHNLLFVMLLALLFGCDAQRIAKLEEGVSSEADVRRQFGEPATVTLRADGSTNLDSLFARVKETIEELGPSPVR